MFLVRRIDQVTVFVAGFCLSSQSELKQKMLMTRMQH